MLLKILLNHSKKALELNVDAIELDVYACESGELVVIHDNKIDRTTNGKGYVTEKTLDELRILDAGDGEKIPLSSEVFDIINKKVKINIELKGNKVAKHVNDLIQDYIKNKGWKYKHFIISSFNIMNLSDSMN